MTSGERPALTRSVQQAVHDTARREGPTAALSALYEAIGRDTPLRGPGGHALVPEGVRHDAADTAVLPGIDGLGLLPLRGPTAPDAPAREPEPEGGPIGPAAWAEALTWLRLGLSVRILDEALGYLRDRVTGGSPLLSRQLIKGALADAVALQLQVRSVLDAHAPGDVPRPLSAGLNAMVTQADRILLPLLGASGFTTEGPGRVAHASELLVDTYFTIAQEGTEPC